MSNELTEEILLHLACFKNRFQEFLEERKLTVRAFAAETGIAASGIYAFLKPSKSPSLETASKITEYFQCSLDYLFGFTENERIFTKQSSESVNTRIKRAIDESVLSRYKISQMTGIGESDLCKWYNAQKEPAFVGILALAITLNQSLDFLVGRDD